MHNNRNIYDLYDYEEPGDNDLELNVGFQDRVQNPIKCKYHAIYLGKVITALLGGVSAFTGSALAAQSFGVEKFPSFIFGVNGFLSQSLINISGLQNARALQDRQNTPMTLMNKFHFCARPVIGLTIGVLSSSTGSSIFKTLEVENEAVEKALNLFFAICTGLSFLFSSHGANNASSEIHEAYNLTLDSMSDGPRFLLKIIEIILFISALLILLELVPALSALISKYIYDSLLSSIISYISLGVLNSELVDLYYNGFKTFITTMTHTIRNFGLNKFKNTLQIIFSVIFALTESMTCYGYSRQAMRQSLINFKMNQSDTAEIAFAVGCMLCLQPCAAMSGIVVSNKLYDSAASLYNWVRSKMRRR